MKMRYEDYIDLGFKRIETHDNVVFMQTGYHEYILTLKLNDAISIEVYGRCLNEPKMYIQTSNNPLGDCIVFDVKPENVRDIKNAFFSPVSNAKEAVSAPNDQSVYLPFAGAPFKDYVSNASGSIVDSATCSKEQPDVSLD